MPNPGDLQVRIRPVVAEDADAVWRLLEPVLRDGETYALPRDMTRSDALAYWLGSDRRTFVAEQGGEIVGSYYLRVNQRGGGSHVANCGYITDIAAQGRGVARAMCLHSLDEARRLGFRDAVQLCRRHERARAAALGEPWL